MRNVLLIVALLLLASCRQAASTPMLDQAAQINLTINPQPPAVGDSTLSITVTQQNQPLANVAVDARGDMTHAGMRPILASVKTDAQGKADIPFKWSMSGDWIVTITVTLADHSQVSQDFNVTVKP